MSFDRPREFGPPIFGGSNKRLAEILERFPGPLRLQPSTLKWFVSLVLALAFVGIGVWIIQRGATGYDLLMAWSCVILFGTCAVGAAIMLLPGSAGLMLDGEGFTSFAPWRRSHHRWADVSNFEAQEFGSKFGGTCYVLFDDRAARGSLLAGMNREIDGRNSGLPDTYGFKADELAQFMSLWSERARQLNKESIVPPIRLS